MSQHKLSLIDNAAAGDSNALELLDAAKPAALDRLQRCIEGQATHVAGFGDYEDAERWDGLS